MSFCANTSVSCLLLTLGTVPSLTGKIQKVVDLCTKAGKAPVDEIEGEIHNVLSLAEYQKMYGENMEAKSQWLLRGIFRLNATPYSSFRDIFVKGLQVAKQLDKSRQAKLHVLQVIRNKSSVCFSPVACLYFY